MTHDYIYYYDKNKNRHLLGELDISGNGFNQGYSLSTPHSFKANVYSYELSEQLTAFTICWHENTNTWWIISKDQVRRNYHEFGFLYEHSIQFVEAIELLNARDLTDCGFNQNRYTIYQFIVRLFSLSAFEFGTPTIVSGNANVQNVDLSQIVDYVKSYENYSLLSALRDFLGGYNIKPMLTFVSGETLTSAILTLLPKSGRLDLDTIELSSFNDVREIKNTSKESYGSTVVSNVENVISTKDKTFPLVGGVRLSSKEYTIVNTNAILRLPSNVFKVNWLRMYYPLHIYADINGASQGTFTGYVDTYEGAELAYNWFYDLMPNSAKAQIEANKDIIINKIMLAGRVTFYSGAQYNPINDVNGNRVTPPQDNPLWYAPKFRSIVGTAQLNSEYLFDEETVQSMEYPHDAIRWKRGSNIIDNFIFLAKRSGTPLAGQGPLLWPHGLPHRLLPAAGRRLRIQRHCPSGPGLLRFHPGLPG